MNVLKQLPVMLLLTGLYSCEKVIEVDLNNTPSQVVIEANLPLDENRIEVRITRSADYFDASELETIETANIVLSDNEGLNVIVPHVGNGFYAVEVEAETSHEYTLTVEAEGETYTASSQLLEPVLLQELELEFVGNSLLDEGYLVYSRFQDAETTDNYYRFIHSINGEEQREGDNLQVVDDRFIEGGFARIPIFGTTFPSGDTITIELQHIDRAAFDYFDSLADIIGDGNGPAGNSAAPANPITNWVGGDVLGYFAASSSDKQTVILPN